MLLLLTSRTYYFRIFRGIFAGDIVASVCSLCKLKIFALYGNISLKGILFISLWRPHAAILAHIVPGTPIYIYRL